MSQLRSEQHARAVHSSLGSKENQRTCKKKYHLECATDDFLAFSVPATFRCKRGMQIPYLNDHHIVKWISD